MVLFRPEHLQGPTRGSLFSQVLITMVFSPPENVVGVQRGSLALAPRTDMQTCTNNANENLIKVGGGGGKGVRSKGEKDKPFVQREQGRS